MTSTMRRSALTCFWTLLALGASASASAKPIVWVVHPVSGQIVMVDPRTGGVLGSFDAPIAPHPGDTRLGLSMAEGGRTLLYELGNPTPDGSFDGSRSMFRLDPFTGAIKSRQLGLGTYWGTDGLSWERRHGKTFTYFSHANPIPDIHRYTDLGEEDEEETLFFGPPWPDFYPVGGLGGDGHGREFGVFIDPDKPAERLVIEYDPFEADSWWHMLMPAPAPDIEGLAFDGRYLYASSASGLLFTLDPDTGHIVRTVALPPTFVSGPASGYVFDIAATPEPGALALLVLAGIGIAARRTRRGTRLTSARPRP